MGRPGFARKTIIQASFQVGKYLVTDLTREAPGGEFRAAVSIRSGRGRATHDRVLRFSPSFDSVQAASLFARDQALAWLNVSAPSSTESPLPALRSPSRWPKKN
jgi:hypothetical protein